MHLLAESESSVGQCLDKALPSRSFKSPLSISVMSFVSDHARISLSLKVFYCKFYDSILVTGLVVTKLSAATLK